MFTISKQLDTRYLNLPQALLHTLRAMAAMEPGQVLQLTTCDHGAVTGVDKLCRQTGLVLLQYMVWDGEYTFFLRKLIGRASGLRQCA